MSWMSLMRNKGRAVLTVLGIVIGVASVILMLAVGQAAEKLILSQVASFGSDLVIVRNGAGDGGTGSGPPTTSVKQTLTMKDYNKIKQLSWVGSVGANTMSSMLVEYAGESKRLQIAGVTEAQMVIFDTQVDQGVFITSDDVESDSKIAVLGSDEARDLFGQENPIGKRIKINKSSYRVVGIMKPAGTRFFTNLDKQIYVPVTALMREMGTVYLQYMTIKIGNLSQAEAKQRIMATLRDAHNLDNPTGDLAKDDFFIAGQEDIMQRAGIIGSILQILLTSMAAISLVVGGVGIMNIMFVSVTERTREIGLRKAVGAHEGDILGQFLTEAILICVLGGIIGVISGIIISWGGVSILRLTGLGDWAYTIPWGAVALGLGVSTAIGLVFGYYPARRAAKLNPIEALQYE
jgi:putative ABC transport system permease protein